MTFFKQIALVGMILAFVSTSTLALDLTQPIKTMDGSDFVDLAGKPIELTLDKVIINALNNEPVSPGDKDSKDKNFYLTLDIHKNNKDFTFSPEQIVQIRKALAATQPTPIYGAVMMLIDPTFIKNK